MNKQNRILVVIAVLVGVIAVLGVIGLVSLTAAQGAQSAPLSFSVQSLDPTNFEGGQQLIYAVPDADMTPVPIKASIPETGDPFGALDVYIQDQHSPMLFIPFHEHTGVTFTLATTATVGQYSVEIVTYTQNVTPTDWAATFMTYTAFYGYIVDVSPAGNVITFDRQLNITYLPGAEFEIMTMAMNVDGSATRQEYHIYSMPAIDFDITGMHISMICKTEPDDSKFCDQAALDRGISLVYIDGETGRRYLYGTARTNGDMVLFTGIGGVEYTDKAGGGAYSVRIAAEWSNQWGVTIRLRGTTTGSYTPNGRDELYMIVQDDLTDLENMAILGIGHVVE